MPYPDSKDENNFSIQFLEAIASAQFPDLTEVRDLVVKALNLANLPPRNPTLWPLHTFISKALEQNAPINWLTNPSFAENLYALEDILDTLESKPFDKLLKIKNSKGKSVPPPSDPFFLRTVAASILSRPSFPTSKADRRSMLEGIDHIKITLDNKNTINEFAIVLKPEYSDGGQTTVKKWALEMHERGGIRFETMDGKPHKMRVNTAQILEPLVPLLIDELNAKQVSDLAHVDHIHVIMNGRNVIGVQLCPKKNAV